MLEFSADANFAVKRHLFKVSYSYANEEIPFHLDFISPSLELKSGEISYGYLFNTGKILYNINLAVGIAHYIARGERIPDTARTSFVSWNFSSNFRKIEGSAAIFKIPIYLHYRFTDTFSLGLYCSPFILGPLKGVDGGLVLSVGKIWNYI